MNEPISSLTRVPDRAAPDTLEFELGNLLGERKAFGLVAGRCSAAHAECLRSIRESRLYKSRCPTWDEFCPKYLGLSKAFANRVIRALEEFGPAFFELAELTRITPEEFRAVAPLVKDKVLHAGNEIIALVPENANKIAAAVEKLRKAATAEAPAPIRTAVSTIPLSRLRLLERQCGELTAEFRKLAGPKGKGVDRSQLAGILKKTLGMLGRVELELGVF